MSSKISLQDEALHLAQRAKARGLTQSAIAEALKASQSQISRIFSGTSKRRSKLFVAVCKYVFSDAHEHYGGPEAYGAAELYHALDSVWDGSPEHARALVGVIHSLGAFASRAQGGGVQ